MDTSQCPFKRGKRMPQKNLLAESKSECLKATNDCFIKQEKRRVRILPGSAFPIFCFPLKICV